MIIGFSGTRVGMTPSQREVVARIVRGLAHIHGADLIGLHGDCVGADADFDLICQGYGVRRECRPCTYSDMRANTGAFEVAEPIAPMARNRAIVAAADVMIACPPNKERIKQGSGTWATIGFAEKAKKDIYVIFPDGTDLGTILEKEAIEAKS